MTASHSQGQPDDGLGGEQPFLSHLFELRDRLLRIVIAIVVVFVVLFPFANEIYTFVAEPIRAQLPEGSQMIATQVASPFLTPFKLALIAAVFIAMPYILYQFWAFVAPGLYTREKRLAMPLLGSSIVLFYLGMLFAYFVVFPLVFAFFTSVTPDGVLQMPDIAFYLEFVLKLFFAFGIAFEIPIAAILLVAIGATTPEALGRKRPYVIVGVFVAGMLLTPPDVISQTLLAIPMWLLYEVGIFASRFVRRRGGEGAEPADVADGAPVDAVAGSSVPPEPAVPFAETKSYRKSGAEGEVGRDISGGDPDEPGRFRPMTEEEMEEEMDLIEADEVIDDVDEAAPDLVQVLLDKADELRSEGSTGAARQVLYRVLEDGDDRQRMLARNTLAQMDSR